MTRPLRPLSNVTPNDSGFVFDAARPADPQILCYVSYDGGRTWSAAPSKSLGAIGEYRQRVRWWRLGAAENIVLKFTCSEAIPLAVLDCTIEVEGGAT